MPSNPISDYESLWRDTSIRPPNLSGFLKQHQNLELEDRLAIALLDQRLRWATDQPLVVEDYLQVIPELGYSKHLKQQLVVGEIQARRNRNEVLQADEFASRFPDLDEATWQTLQNQETDRSESRDTETSPEQVSSPAKPAESKPNPLSQSLDSIRTVTVELSGPLDSIRTVTVELPNTLDNLRFGRYRMVRILGEGTFGRVYLGIDDELQRQVAVKIPRPERFTRPQDMETYLAEARTVAKLEHPHIVPVYDVGRNDDGLIYVVSKYIHGPTLAERIRANRPDHGTTALWIAKLAEALDTAHRKRLIHRDIKPANILIEEDSQTPFLTDFGLAIAEDDYLLGAQWAGTPAYMSPEQASGEGHRLDARSDAFSLGTVLYETLSGKTPFSGSTANEILQQVIERAPQPPRQIDGQIPHELERICLKALSKRVSDRYQNVGQMAAELRSWQTGLQPIKSKRQMVPKGLRSFDAGDADFFLDLLPGNRDRQGLPESITFWKERVEQTDPEQTFRVGLLYGPSGCGKSSLIKAGLVPRLSNDVIAIYVEPAEASLRELLASIRRSDAPKTVIIIDQFEQWLHNRRVTPGTELVAALRHCDGGRLQAIVLVRDDFAMAAARFMDALDIPIVQGENFRTVDRFDLEHAAKVLIKFGQAYGRLPETSSGETVLTVPQQSFIEKVVSGLAVDGQVISVQLALLAEMIKQKPWEPETLAAVGGTSGIGVAFLEETFASRSANPKHLQHAPAARAILRALLPESGNDIKGHMRSAQELVAAINDPKYTLSRSA